MQVTELLALTEWIRTQVQEAGIPELYQALQTKLHSNAQGQAQQPFEEEKDALFKGLRGARLQDLTNMTRLVGWLRSRSPVRAGEAWMSCAASAWEPELRRTST